MAFAATDLSLSDGSAILGPRIRGRRDGPNVRVGDTRVALEPGPRRWCGTWLRADDGRWFVGCGPQRGTRFLGGLVGPVIPEGGVLHLPATVRDLPALPVADARSAPFAHRSLAPDAEASWSACFESRELRGCQEILEGAGLWEPVARVWAAARACEIASGVWCRILAIQTQAASLSERVTAEFLALAFLRPRSHQSRVREAGVALRRLVSHGALGRRHRAAAALLPEGGSETVDVAFDPF